MKIAILVSTFPPYHGGMGNVAADHARELARLGHHVTVMTPAPHRAHTPSTDEPYRVEHLTPILRWGNAASIPGVIRRLREFDVVMLHYPFFGTAELFIMRQIRRMCKKLILVYHMDLVGQGMLGAFFRWHTKTLLPHIFHHSDRIVVSSLDYAFTGVLGTMPDDIRKKVAEFPIGVDTDRFSPTSLRDVKSPRLLETALFVGALDRAHYFKGVPVLLEAWARNSKLLTRNIRLIIAGDGDLREQYEAQARGFGIADRVRFLGRVDDDDLPDLYRAADVVVLPSIDRSEAFGKVLLEAQACGIPVIASNLPGVRTVLKDGETGMLVRPNDVADLVRALRGMLDDSDRTAAMGRAARKLIEEKFSWDVLRSNLSRLVDR